MQPDAGDRPDTNGDDGAYALFFSRSPRPMYVYDVESLRLVDVNDAALQLYGFDRVTFLAMTVLELRAPEDVPAFLEYLNVERHAGTMMRQRTSDGTTLHVEVSWTRYERESRELQIVVLTDVTEREHARTRLANSERRFRTIFESNPIGIVLSNPSFEILDANPAFCRFVGYPRDELLTKTILELTHPDEVPADARLGRKIFGGKVPSAQREKRYVTADGKIVWGSLTASAIVDQDGVAIGGLGVVEDITERKEREEQAASAAAEAQGLLSELTRRERELLDAIHGETMTTRELASTLHISARTAESHLSSIYRKLRVASRDAALLEYERLLERVDTPLLTSRYAQKTRELRT